MANPCPPLAIDPELDAMIESYRRAKSEAQRASQKRVEIEHAGHYDKDATDPRPWIESEAALAERRAAVAVADEVLKWVDRHRR